MKISRRFTIAGADPFAGIEFTRRRSAIYNMDGSALFEADNVEIPVAWEQVAVDIVVSKYFRRAGVPQVDASGKALLKEDGSPVLGGETSVKQWAMRLANAWRIWGERAGYLATEDDALAYRDEMARMLVEQLGSPNSPQHFNTGLFEAYNIVADPEGNWYVDPETGETKESKHRFERAAVNACFVNSINDELVGPGSIFDFFEREARLFKSGSGSGANMSSIRGRGEALSGGGTSSGVMSFMRVADRAAGAIKSGGTTRRAAKMVILDVDHPEIEDFIWCKYEEEKKVAALVAGGYSPDWNGEAYDTVSFQNGNNSVRIMPGFMQAVKNGEDWHLKGRNKGEVMKTVPAQKLWNDIAEAAWLCADPGVQFDDLLNDWNTAANDSRLRTTNPCSEYTHVDDTACNLASLNLVKYFDDETQTFDYATFIHAARLFTLTLEISVAMSHYPAEIIARNSFEHRTLGLGYANLGALLMRAGIAYDSPEGVAVTGAITALMHDTAYATSAEMAGVVGPCVAYERNVEPMTRVLKNHARSAFGSRLSESNLGDYEGLTVAPQGIDHGVLARTPFASLSDIIVKAARGMLKGLANSGYRNMQTTVLAPTGCILPESLISSSHGLVRLDELGDPQGATWQDVSIDVLTDQGAKAATKFYSNGLSEVVKVQTKHGYSVTGTPEHRVKAVLKDGSWVWRRFGEIKPGEVLPLALDQMVGLPVEVKLPSLPEMHWSADFGVFAPSGMTADLAELVGHFMGSGSFSSDKLSFSLSEEDFELKDRILELGKKLFNVEVSVSAQKDKQANVLLELNSLRVASWWKACKFTKITSGATGMVSAHVPSGIRHTNDKEIYQAFLKGLFVACGSVKEGILSLSLCFSFAKEARSLLLSLGFPTSSVAVDMPAVKASTTAAEVEVSFFNESYSYQFARKADFFEKSTFLGESIFVSQKDLVPLSLDLLKRVAARAGDITLSQDVFKSHEESNGLVPRHLVKMLFDLTDDQEMKHLLGFFYDTVESSALNGSAFTYDLSVPENVTYVANGFVSHNTIGLQMDCDTTGIEPDFALVKFKKLAGGGYMKIVNRSVAPALKTLGYAPEEVSSILAHALGTQRLDGGTAINKASLLAKNVPLLAIERAEAQLISVTELPMAFARYTIGDDALEAMKVPREVYQSSDFNLLTYLGYSNNEIFSSSNVICGHQTVEGASALKDEHLAVFDTANYCGDGTRVIAWEGHVRALSAVAPHLSGSASKTINLPNEATLEEIKGAYNLAYELGVKCAAVYRDGSKLSQVLSSQKAKEEEEKEAVIIEEVITNVLREIQPGESPSNYYHNTTPPKFRMPDMRYGPTWKLNVGGTEIFLRANEYDDGSLGEIFLDLSKEGSTLKGVLSCFAIAVSQGLQHGVPIAKFVDSFTFHNFAPNGPTTGGSGALKMSTSIIDAVFKTLAFHYCGREDLVQVPSKESKRIVRLNPGEEAVVVPKGMKKDLFASLETNGASAGKADSNKVDVSPSVHATSESLQEPDRVQTGSMPSSGETCMDCGGQMVKSGTCSRCLNCGATSGCS